MNERSIVHLGLVIAAGLTVLLASSSPVLAQAARRAAGAQAAAQGEGGVGAPGDYHAYRLLERAVDLLNAGEHERGVKMLETLLDQYPSSDIRFKVWLTLGKHFLEQHQQLRAINYFRNLRLVESEPELLRNDRLDMFLESLYLTGVAYFQMRQYGSAFPVLRKITMEHPNTVWANQAFYYIGMCHFAQENWNKAIESLSVVGTFIDPESPAVEYVEAGRRFYIKIVDRDLPVAYRLGQEVKVKVRTTGGDEEVVTCVPLAGDAEVFIGSIPTELGAPKKGDDMLQVVSGDRIETIYTDANTYAGDPNVARKAEVRVVSTGVLTFTLGDFGSRAAAAFVGQPVFITLSDADLSVSASADTATLRVVSRFREAEDEDDFGGRGVNIERLFRDEADMWRVRDEVTITLTEIGTGNAIRTGLFGASLPLDLFRPDVPVDRTDNSLSVAIDDEIVATYVDELHIGGTIPREVQASIRVVSELDAKPRATQFIVQDPVVLARKNLVEAEAHLELGKIFKSMGLMAGAAEKCDEGLSRADEIIRIRQPIPSDLVEEAFRLKWELYLVKEDYRNAIATCQLFNRLYPESPLVDEAMMRIGMAKMENKEYKEAISLFGQILRLTKSQVKAEAQFRIAEALEADKSSGGRGDNRQPAIAAYKLCAERYPDSEFAGAALAKLVDYYIETRDYAQADDLLERIFQDYPDANFLDSMLLKWVMVAFRVGNFQKAYDKCSELIFEHPSSAFAERAKAILPRIEARIQK